MTYTLSGTCPDSRNDSGFLAIDCLTLEEENNSGFSIYPNPSKGFDHVFYNVKKYFQELLRFRDTTGRIIYSKVKSLHLSYKFH